LRPRATGQGATLGIAAPAFAVEEESLQRGVERLREAGFQVRLPEAVRARSGYLAGDDALRARAFMALVDDPEVDAIVCARGGFGCQRMLSGLDAERVRRAAKPLVGFSDVTALLLWQQRVAGLSGFHGPMLERSEGPLDQELQHLRRALAGDPLPPLRGEPLRPGRAQGPLVGGSLTLLAASLGSVWEVETRGAILLLEDVGEKPYALDRLLQQLRAAGKLDGVVGVGVGSLTGCEDARRPQPSAEAVLEEVLAPLGVPLVLALPFGHRSPNLIWPVGVPAVLDGERGELQVLEAGVAAQ